MKELQLSPISPKFVPPQPLEQQAQQQSQTLHIPAENSNISSNQNQEQEAKVPQFTAAEDLAIQSSVLTAPLSPQFDFNLLYYLQAGMQRSQNDQRERQRGQYRSYKPSYPSSQDRFLGRM